MITASRCGRGNFADRAKSVAFMFSDRIASEVPPRGALPDVVDLQYLGAFVGRLVGEEAMGSTESMESAE